MVDFDPPNLALEAYIKKQPGIPNASLLSTLCFQQPTNHHQFSGHLQGCTKNGGVARTKYRSSLFSVWMCCKPENDGSRDGVSCGLHSWAESEQGATSAEGLRILNAFFVNEESIAELVSGQSWDTIYKDTKAATRNIALPYLLTSFDIAVQCCP
jgi:hypothetical protein